MTKDKAKTLLDNLIGMVEDNQASDYDKALRMAIAALEQQPCGEMVHVETLHQVMWERDIAIGQLKELGYDFGQKIEPCDDAISRQAILDGIEELKKSPWATDKRGNGFEYLITETLDVVKDLCVKHLPSVTQKPTVDMLEQIRAEIEQSRYGLVNDGLDLALKIIDKYTKG